MRSLTFSLLLLAAVACRVPTTSGPVPVQGSASERHLLAGEWSGRYWSEATGRHGIIRFVLPERADTGFGDVEITFSPTLRLTHDAPSADPTIGSADELDPHPTTVINIRVVVVEADSLRGTMALYWDPDCNCQAQTVFEGKISGNQITGTFTSRRGASDRRLLTGAWRAEREGS
jgi:hypothetical protein